MISGSVLLYHNGNQRVINWYRQIFRYHSFRGNWADHTHHPENNSLYEICIADATDEALIKAKNLGIRVLRFVSSFQDDQTNAVHELQLQSYDDWLVNVVCKNLCFADVIQTDFVYDHGYSEHGLIVTTGRTANTHLQLHDPLMSLVESSKKIDSEFLKAKYAILLWRVDQWQCLTSSWILQTIGPVHQFNSILTKDIKPIPPISIHWIQQDWKNLCLAVLDLALFFHYIIQRPIHQMTTEDVVVRLKSKSEKINYNKHQIIPNYYQMQTYYEQSDVKKLITMCYNNTLTHII